MNCTNVRPDDFCSSHLEPLHRKLPVDSNLLVQECFKELAEMDADEEDPELNAMWDSLFPAKAESCCFQNSNMSHHDKSTCTLHVYIDMCVL